MGGYLALVRISAQLAFANRAWLALRCTGALVWIGVAYGVWRSVFSQHESVARFDWPQMKTYLLVGALFTVLLSTDGGLGQRIVRGQVAVDLTRPLRLGAQRLAESSGQAAPELVVCVLLALLATAAIGGCALPGTLAGWAALALSIALAALLKFSIVHAWTLACFWTYNAYGVEKMRLAITALLSGAVVPIALFPSWLREIAQLLPFQGVVVAPAEIAIGHGGASGTLRALATQVGWIVVLTLLAHRLWRRGVRQLAVQGG